MSKRTTSALENARKVEMTAKRLSAGVSVAGNGEILIKVAMTNKRETPSVVLHTKKKKSSF
jgi:hypothetical protein